MRQFTIHILTLLLCFTAHAAEVQIIGVSEQERKTYIDQLGPRLKYISTRSATSWRADDAAFYLDQLISKRGYAKATVDWTINGNTIILKVVQGERMYYGTALTNSQITFTQQELADYFFQPLVDGELVSQKNPPYIPEYTKKGAANVENFMKSSSYWDAKAAVIKESRDPNTGRINVHLDIQQGGVHTLARPQFSGITPATEQEILQECGALIGQASTTENIVALNSTVSSYFRRTGYHFAKTEVETSHANRKTILNFSIDQGQRYTLNRVIISGNRDTQTKRIERHYKDLKGNTYDAERANKATNKLLRSGIFQRVEVTPQTHQDGTLDLSVEVEEGKSVTTSAYLGTDSYEGPIFGLAYSDLNFAGKMWQLSARGEYTGRGLLGEVGITEPFFLGENVSFNVRAFALQRRPDGYQKYETGLESSWTYQVTDDYAIRAFLATGIVSTSSDTMTDEELGPKDYVNTRFGVRQSLDLRNDPILPQQGYNGELLTEFGSIVGDATTAYFKADLNNSYRFEMLQGRQYLISRFDIGLISPAESRSLPIDRRFFSGGTNSVRSFDERGLGPRSSAGDPLGGEAYWVGSAELVRKIKGPIYASAFYDLGQVFSNFEDLSFGDPSQAIGLSARIHLPIGPIRFEYGYNLNRKPKEPTGTFHFTIGASF